MKFTDIDGDWIEVQNGKVVACASELHRFGDGTPLDEIWTALDTEMAVVPCVGRDYAVLASATNEDGVTLREWLEQ